MTDTLALVRDRIIPAAYDLLPTEMASKAATAMLLVIGLQESGFQFRVQYGGGPAVGFWQFELSGGTQGVLNHPKTAGPIQNVMTTLGYINPTPLMCEVSIRHNDIIGAAFARCLLFTSREPLPSINEPDLGWAMYISVWRPGKPRPEHWEANYAKAWALMESQA